MNLNEAAAMISGAMDNVVERLANRSKGELGIGLTGGHDSRVILGSLAHKDVPFKPLLWADGDFNDEVALRLAAIAKKTPTVVCHSSAEQLWRMKEQGFRYSDGSCFHSTGFAELGRECLERQIPGLMLGFAGDKSVAWYQCRPVIV